MDLVKEIICSKLRACNKEFGSSIMTKAILIGPERYFSVSNLQYITTPTLSQTILGGVPFKIARFFEDFDYHA